MTDAMRRYAERLRGIVPVRFDEPLAKHTSFRIGGPADAYVQARTLDQLVAAVRAAWDLGLPAWVFGGGSNILVLDGGIRGVVIEARARRVTGLPTTFEGGGSGDEALEISAEAGTPLAALGRKAVALGLAGLEWAVDVPGTVGGAVVNNAGAHGGDMASSIAAALVLSPQGELDWQPVEALEMAYRTSKLKLDSEQRPVVVAAKMVLRRGDPLSLREAAARYSQHRRRTQPVGACAGSMFKNPPDQTAGWYVEQAQLKGTQVGAARVSELHGNFFLNLGGATAADVLALVDVVRERVRGQFGVALELEIQVVGEMGR